MPLTLPDIGSSDWGEPLNANFSMVNELLFNGSTIRLPSSDYQGSTFDAQFNAAHAALPAAGGIIICQYGPSIQTIAAPLVVGGASKQVTVIIDRGTQFNVAVTGGVDAIQLWVESSIVAIDMGNVLSVGNFALTSAANIDNLIASYPRSGPTITNMRGITCVGHPSATVGGSIIDMIGVTDKSTIQECIVYGIANCYGLRIRNAAGGVPVGPVNITNCSINGSGNAGAKPVLISGVTGGGVIADVNFFGGSMTHPGPGGLAMVDIQGTATNVVNGVNFYGTQFESFNTGDIGININNGLGIVVNGCLFSSYINVGTSCIKIAQSGGGVSYNLVFDTITNFNSWTNTIQDTINSVNYTAPRISRWTSLPPTNGAYVIQNLPAFANNAAAVSGGAPLGSLYRSTDAICVVH